MSVDTSARESRPFRRPHFIEGSPTCSPTRCAAARCGRFGGRTSLREVAAPVRAALHHPLRPFRRPHFIEGGCRAPGVFSRPALRPSRRPHFIEGWRPWVRGYAATPVAAVSAAAIHRGNCTAAGPSVTRRRWLSGLRKPNTMRAPQDPRMENPSRSLDEHLNSIQQAGVATTD